MEKNVGREEVSNRAHNPEFVQLYLNNYSLLMGYVLGKLENKNPAAAEEIVQEVFVEALFHLRESGLNKCPERWLLNKAFEKVNASVKKENV